MKARLSKEAQVVSEGQQASTKEPYRYSFAAAETLSEDFKILGFAVDGSTYLDCIRRLIIGIKISCKQYLTCKRPAVPETVGDNLTKRCGKHRDGFCQERIAASLLG